MSANAFPVARLGRASAGRVPDGATSDVTPLGVALRRKWSILAFAGLAACGAEAALSFVTPRYASEADVRIDMPQPRVVDENAAILPRSPLTLESLRTEMAALASPALAQQAARTLGLTSLPEYQDCTPVSLSQRVAALARRAAGANAAFPAACHASIETAGRVLLGHLSFVAAKDSYIIQITASASDPRLAARMANGYAASYVGWQKELKAQLAQDADDWLSHQLDTMHGRMLAADAALERYRQSHHLFGLHAAQPGQMPDTLRAQQLAQSNQALGETSASLAEARSTVGQMRQALHDGAYDRVAPALQSPVVQQLLERHADLVGQLAQLRAQYGSGYPAVITAAAAIARIEAQTRTEVQRVAAALDGQASALASKRDVIAATVARLETRVAGESRDDVRLEELEREAATERSVYETLFVRLKQVDAERWLERANAAVVVEATPPLAPEYPHKTLMTVGTFLACLGVGTALAFAQEVGSRRFRDADQVEGEIGLPVLGVFAKRSGSPQAMSLDAPHSMESETLHAVLAQVLGSTRVGTACTTALVTSALPREGKSCFSVALGRAAASAGLSVFVLDCDLRNPSVHRLIQENAAAASGPADKPATLLDIAAGAGEPDQQIAALMREARTDPRCGLRYLQLTDYVANPRGLLAWPGLPALVRHLRDRCDLVILDAPPVLAVSDALQLGPLADRVLMLIDWQETPRQATQSAVRTLHRAGVTVDGAVMTKVDMRRFARKGGLYIASYGTPLDQAA